MTTGQKVAVGGLRAGGLGAEGGVAAGGGDAVARGWEDPQSGLGGEHPRFFLSRGPLRCITVTPGWSLGAAVPAPGG